MLTTAIVVVLVVLLGAQVATLARRPPRHRHRRSRAPVRTRTVVVAAMVVGLAARVAWVTWATRQPTGFTDPAEYLRIALDLGNGILPRFGGLEHSAYWPPGYPAVLAPFATVADRTGWVSVAYTASLVNVVAGTITIGLSALLARRWLGPKAAGVAAWLVALCPALVYWTSTAHAETVFTMVFLAGILVGSRLAERSRTRDWALFGVLVAAAFLIRSPGVILVAVPALALRAGGRSWRDAGRATAALAAGACLLLVPWAVRNGVQVGVWSPGSTNNAAAVCFGHHDDAEARWDPQHQTPEIARDCFGNSPFDDRRLLAVYEEGGLLPPGTQLGEPDEPRYYREALGSAIGWALTHPVDEVRLSAEKVWETWHGEGRVVDGARNYEADWAGRWEDRLTMLADLWLWLVGPAALAALTLRPACRRASPLWVPILLYTLAIVGGVAEPHYRYPVMPLVAVLAAGLQRSSVDRSAASSSG